MIHRNVIASIHRQLLEKGDPQRRRIQKRYLKSPFKFYGVSRTAMQQIAKSLKKQYPEMTQQELLNLCRRLWQDEFHECKSISIDIMKLFNKHIDANAVPLIDHMIDTATGWDHIDEIAIRLVGYLLITDPVHFNYIKSCAKSDNFWKRRVSIISQIKLYRTEYFNQKLFLEICSRHLQEKEFFIRKSIGWALRELSKTQPDVVYQFILKNQAEMSGLTFREASRRLPEEMRNRLLKN